MTSGTAMAAESRRPTLLLADDHELMLDGLRQILVKDFELVATVNDGRSAVEAFATCKPDLLLLDISLPLLNGIEVARQVKKRDPSACVIFVTMQMDRYYVEHAMQAGGSGYVLKQAAASELVEAIHTVLSGRVYLSPLLLQKLGPIDIKADLLKASGSTNILTPRQREVLQLVAEGKSMKEIASLLGVSVRTVEFHKNSISGELGLRTTAALTRYAIQHGLVSN